MLAFKLTFLLSVSTKPVIEEKTKLVKSKRGSKVGIVDSKPKSEIYEELKEYELKTEEFVHNFKIEYELFPNKFSYSIDVTCWKNVAKISTVDGIRYYKLIKCGDISWVPLTIHHFRNKLSNEELLSLHSHTIKLFVNSPKKDSATKAILLYCLEEEVKSDKFVEYFEENPNSSKRKFAFGENQDMKEMEKAASKCTDSTFSSWLQFTGETHCYKVYEILSSLKKGERVKYRDVPHPPDNEEKVDIKSSGKKQIEKKKEPYFIVPGEVFFTNPAPAIYKLKEKNEKITNGFLLLSVQNLMTRSQKDSFNPFVVKVKSLNNLPATFLQKHGYNKVFVSYEIPNILKQDSLTKPIEENIHFEDCHAFLMNDHPRVKYLEFIRGKRIKVQINGVKERKIKPLRPALFGTRKIDVKYSKRLQPREALDILRQFDNPSTTEILAVTSYDISSLLKGVWSARLEEPCHHPDNLIYGVNPNPLGKFLDVRTMAEINLELIDYGKSKSPLLDGILTTSCTSLDMEFYFMAPQNDKVYFQLEKNRFHRFFFILFDRSLAQHIFALILQKNELIVGFNAAVADPFLVEEDLESFRVDLKKRKESVKTSISDVTLKAKLEHMVHEMDDILTGFVIDNGKEIYFYVEGIVYGCILEIWNKIHKLNPSIGIIYMNSELDFQNRLYEGFLRIGLLKIILKKSFEEIFDDYSVYVEGMIPIPCFRALQKLNILLQTDSLREMFKFDLFPTSNELISFALEYGVPLKMYQ